MLPANGHAAPPQPHSSSLPFVILPLFLARPPLALLAAAAFFGRPVWPASDASVARSGCEEREVFRDY